MKSRKIFWKHCLVSFLSLASFAVLTGCKKLTCDFTYSPATPRAGETITFSNLSTGADDYYWNFGDNVTATTSSPAHIYKKPGTYTVTLSVVRNKVEKRTRTQHITVADTIPALAASEDTIHTFTPITFYVNRYNPWGKQITYAWTAPKNAVVIAGKDQDSSAIVCYFTNCEVSTIQTNMHMEGRTPLHLSYAVAPIHQKAQSVLYNYNQEAWEQFSYIINKRPVFSTATITQDETNKKLLNSEQDTLYQYGDSIFTVDKVRKLVSNQSIKGFQADRLMGKIYAYGEGLWVFNIAGTPAKLHKYQLDKATVSAIKVDGGGNRVYWATGEGLLTLPLIGTEINQNTYTPDTLNHISGITRISVNSNLH